MTNPNTNEIYLREHYENYLDDNALFISEGGDYDEILQEAVDTIADEMGITPTNQDNRYEDETSDYFLLKEILNDIIADVLDAE